MTATCTEEDSGTSIGCVGIPFPISVHLWNQMQCGRLNIFCQVNIFHQAKCLSGKKIKCIFQGPDQGQLLSSFRVEESISILRSSKSFRITVGVLCFTASFSAPRCLSIWTVGRSIKPDETTFETPMKLSYQQLYGTDIRGDMPNGEDNELIRSTKMEQVFYMDRHFCLGWTDLTGICSVVFTHRYLIARWTSSEQVIYLAQMPIFIPENAGEVRSADLEGDITATFRREIDNMNLIFLVIQACIDRWPVSSAFTLTLSTQSVPPLVAK